MKAKKIDPELIQVVFGPCPQKEEECVIHEVIVSPQWMAENGTPVCNCGDDLPFKEVRIKE